MTFEFAGFTFLIRYTSNFSSQRLSTWTLRITHPAEAHLPNTMPRQAISSMASYAAAADFAKGAKAEIEAYGEPLSFYI